MKPPDHPNPSGDRLIARLLIQALEHTGYQVDLASTFRSRDGAGEATQQQRLQRDGERVRRELISRFEREGPPDLWFSYHLFHKAPDWLGPEISAHFRIPYVVAEASYAPKQTGGPWHSGHQRVAQCLNAADAIVVLNPDDIQCVRPLLSNGCRVMQLTPFINATDFRHQPARSQVAEQFGLNSQLAWLTTVAMMRSGDKLASYHELAQTLTQLNKTNTDWQIVLIGDGEARAEVAQAFNTFPADQVRFAGRLNAQSIARTLPAFDLFVWPAVNEAIGMAMLEAQACGLPVVSTRTGSVDKLIADGHTGLLCESHDTNAMTQACATLLGNSDQRLRFSKNARRRANAAHSTEAAGRQLSALLNLVKEVHH